MFKVKLIIILISLLTPEYQMSNITLVKQRVYASFSDHKLN